MYSRNRVMRMPMSAKEAGERPLDILGNGVAIERCYITNVAAADVNVVVPGAPPEEPRAAKKQRTTTSRQSMQFRQADVQARLTDDEVAVLRKLITEDWGHTDDPPMRTVRAASALPDVAPGGL